MKKKISNKSKWIRETIFAAAIVILPLAWWAFSFFYTTTDTILLAFKSYDRMSQQTTWVGFENFATVIKELKTPETLLNTSLKNSFLLWFINVFISIPAALLVSFALYKKAYGSEFYKVILFLPSIVSGMVWVLVYSFLLDKKARGKK